MAPERSKTLLSKPEIVGMLRAKLEALMLEDAQTIRADVWRVPRESPDAPNWDVSFTGVAPSDRAAVESAGELLRRQVDLA